MLAKALRTLTKVYHFPRELLWWKCCVNRCNVAYFCVINQFRELVKLLVLITGRLLLWLYISLSWTMASPDEAKPPQNCHSLQALTLKRRDPTGDLAYGTPRKL
jgi:hypothetical protein